MSDGTKYNYIANSIILLLVWLLLWNFSVVGYEVYQGIVSFCKWLKVKCAKKNKYLEENGDEEEEEEEEEDVEDGSDREIKFPKRINFFRLPIRGVTKFFAKDAPEAVVTKK